MSPTRRTVEVASNPRPTDHNALILESWAQGFMVGALIIMSFITIANMRRGVILHKLILLELVLGIWQGFWLFLPQRHHVDTWWLSVAAIPLNLSWLLHNIISWMKIKPFLSKVWSTVFLYTVIASFAYWVVEMYANFAYFHRKNPIFKKTRPLELLFRDPWWIITTVYLFIVIKTQYELTIKDILRISPRFGVMLTAMLLSVVFILCDLFSVTGTMKLPGDTGINPFWKFAFVFKCLTDSVILDDFKTALDRLRAFRISRLGSFSGDFSDRRTRNDGNLVETWEKAAQEAQKPHTDPEASATPGPNTDGANARKPPSLVLPHPTRKVDQKEIMVSPTHHPFHLSELSLDPDDIVPSAIEDPPRKKGATYHQEKKVEQEWAEDVDLADAGYLSRGDEYADALKDLNGQSAPSSPSRSAFPRHSRSI